MQVTFMAFPIVGSFYKWLLFTMIYFTLFGFFFFFVMIGPENFNYENLLYFGSVFILFIAALIFAVAFKLKTDAIVSNDLKINNKFFSNSAEFNDIQKCFTLIIFPINIVVIKRRLVPILIPSKLILSNKSEVKYNFEKLIHLNENKTKNIGTMIIAKKYL